MGSKKHKKESKKKKHRSRSRSPLGNEEREKKKHRKHKDRKKDRSPDVEEVPVDSHLQKSTPEPTADSRSSRSTSTERDRRVRSEHRHAHAHSSASHADVEPEPSPVAVDSGGAQASLSIEETNRLRAKLGLKPLQITEKPADDGKIKDDLGEFYHRPAANIAQQKKSDKIKEKLAERKEKRQLEQKLQSTRTLGDASDEDDASAWVARSRQVQQQKEEAARRAALLDEMDAAFGVSALVDEAEESRRSRTYGERHLRGLRVAHRLDALQEERETVLTLADKEVLAEDDEDVLVNVNMLDEERYRKNIEERKKAAKGYQAYDEEAELEVAAGGQRAVLPKYDESGDDRDRGFRIGDEDAAQAAIFRDLLRRQRAVGGDGRRLESLQTAPLQLATDYLDHDEIQFKKVKKRGKLRKRPKTEAIDVEEYEASGAPLHTDDTEAPPALPEDDHEVEVDSELQSALARARRLRQERAPSLPPVPPLAFASENVEEEPAPEEGMVLDATAEFCRTLGDIPTYGLAGNRDRKTEVMELDEELEPEEAGAARGWSSVDVEREGSAAEAHSGASGGALAAEPALGRGVAGALSLARSKGYLERGAGAARPAPSKHALQARHYSIEDKAQTEDDKYSRRERGNLSGPLHDFREKAGFRPSIKLEYVDDDGRPLCPKEAFRYLSHKFHGKGPGKNKQEKRLKKAVQEGLMKKMSSTDTPLNTLQMLQEKQRETRSPYIVLSGAKRPDND